MFTGIWAFFKACAAALGLANKIADAQKAKTERQQGQVEQVAKNQEKVIQDDRKANEARTVADRDSAAGKLRDDDGFRRS
jgi:hypothetical protein